MESGSNKSLYTLIAVVVFGILLSLSYFLFQDNLKGILASVTDGVETTMVLKLDNKGQIPTDAKYFTSVSNGEGTCKITSYNTAGGTDIIIPTVINGLTVTKISNNAFQNKGLNSVILPETLKIIEDGVGSPSDIGAFVHNNLKHIVIPEGVTHIGVLAFCYNQLETVELPSTLTTIARSAFNTNKLKSVILPNSLTTIGYLAFKNSVNLTELTIPKSVTTLSTDILQNSVNVNQVNVPLSLKATVEASPTIFKLDGAGKQPIIVYY